MDESTLRAEAETKMDEAAIGTAPMQAAAGSDSEVAVRADLPSALNLNELQALSPQALEDLCRAFDVRMHPGRTRHHHIVDLVRFACSQGW